MEIQDRPAHYQGPDLDPSSVRMSSRFLGRGVYAMMASKIPRDNSGIPGHGPMGTAEAIDKLIAYLWWLLRKVDEALGLGLTSRAAIEAISLDKRFLVSRFSPASRVNPLIKNFHRLNVLSTYRALAQERGRLASASQAAA